MIKLERIPAPDELDDEMVSNLTAKYENTYEPVWNKSFIKKELLKMSHSKCCYCELKLGEEGKYMQVEHFHCKSLYPKEVVDWENLLPSCNRCNTNKGAHDTYKEPIVDPCREYPNKYLYMENYRIKSRNNNIIGCRTIDVLYLNASDDLVLPRFNVGNKIQEKLEMLKDSFSDYLTDTRNIRRRNKIVNTLKEILFLADSSQEYSATAATIIATDCNYKYLKKQFSDLSLWTSELQTLHDNAYENALLKNPNL